MTLIGFVGILIALSAAYFADIKSSRLRFVVFVLLFVLHTLATVAFYFFVESSGGDARFYYDDTLGFYGHTSGLGTAVIINFVQYLKTNIGGTMMDYFMLFQATGFWGLVVISRIIQEIFEEVGAQPSSWTYAPLFLPGLHFWTAAIGKDAPVFLAIALSIWATMQLGKRLPALGIAIMLMVAVRPHIGVLALMALGFAALLDRRTKLWVKTMLVIGIVAGGAVVAGNIQSTLHLDTANVESVGQYMEARTSVNESSGADRAITEGNLLVKLASLWFRPFFIDAENMMGYMASLENVALLIIMIYIARNFRTLLSACKKVLYMRYSSAMFLAITFLLAAVNYNVGLGLRQKMMAMPCLLAIFVTIVALKAARRSQAGIANRSTQAGQGRLPAAYLGG